MFCPTIMARLKIRAIFTPAGEIFELELGVGKMPHPAGSLEIRQESWSKGNTKEVAHPLCLR